MRAATAADFERIVDLNARWSHFTSDLDGVSLERMHRAAAYHRMIERDSQVLAFLIAFGPGADYASPNYRWFEARHDDFLYIDRVVVSGELQRSGLGSALYDDVTRFARSRDVRRLVCEVDAEPYNATSDRFHERRGFVEIGTQWVADGAKRVSMRELVLE